MAQNHPDWPHVGWNAEGHAIYNWPDQAGNVHTVTGHVGRAAGTGAKKVPLEKITGNLNRYTRRCELGACSHVFSNPSSEEPAPEEIPQTVPYTPGAQVSYQGEPHYVTAADVIDNVPYYDLAHATTGEPQEMVTHDELDPPITPHVASILDPIHATLDPRVFDHPEAPEPTLRQDVQTWITTIIFEVLQRHGYDNPDKWLTLVLTGSLTTYQYSDGSDCDISLFIDAKRLPDWSRAEMIGIMVSDFDNIDVPGTTYPIQAYVVAPGIQPKDLYKPGLRSGLVVYGKGQGHWLVPPDRTRVHDVEKEMNDAYTVGLLAADKMDLLLRYEPDKAIEYWHSLHKQRMQEQSNGHGDFATSNIIYKMLSNRGLTPEIAKLTGEHIA